MKTSEKGSRREVEAPSKGRAAPRPRWLSQVARATPAAAAPRTTHHWRPRQRHLGWAGVTIHSSHALTAADSYNRPHTHLLIHKSAYGPDALSLYHLAHKRTHLYALILTLFLARTHTGSFYLTHTHTHTLAKESLTHTHQQPPFPA